MDESLNKCVGYLVVDAKSVYDLLHKDGSVPQEKRVSLDVLAVREALTRVSERLCWVPTRQMLADMLTKLMLQADYADYVLSTGRLSLVESEEARAVERGDFLEARPRHEYTKRKETCVELTLEYRDVLFS